MHNAWQPFFIGLTFCYQPAKLSLIKEVRKMRLDKYLQVTGLIKRRALANEACKRELVKVNQQPAKATKEVSVGDIIEIVLAKREITVKVLQEIKGTSLKKSIRSEYFEILKDISKKIEEDDDDFWE